VWVTNAKTPATALSTHATPLSYLVDSPSGTIRRHRQHLVPLPETTSNTEKDEKASQVDHRSTEEAPEKGECHTCPHQNQVWKSCMQASKTELMK